MGRRSRRHGHAASSPATTSSATSTAPGTTTRSSRPTARRPARSPISPSGRGACPAILARSRSAPGSALARRTEGARPLSQLRRHRSASSSSGFSRRSTISRPSRGLQDALKTSRAPWARCRWARTSLFDAGIGVDDKNPNAYVVFVSQSRARPSRPRLLSAATRRAPSRRARPITNISATCWTWAASPTPQKKADAIFALETEIAKLHWPRSRAPRRREDLQSDDRWRRWPKLAPQFPWRAFSARARLRRQPRQASARDRRGNTAFPKLAALFAADAGATCGATI